MELIGSVLLFITGLVIIICSGNWMVKSASKISVITGIPQAIIGATIVSLATTLPELNVVIFSAIDGYSGLAVGNSIGSIIFNLTFIIGIVLLFTRSTIKKSALGVNYIIMVFVIILLFIFSALDIMNIWTGMILLTIFLLFFIHNIIDASKRGVEIEVCAKLNTINNIKINKASLWLTILSFCISSFFVSTGAKMLVSSGESIARLLNISEHIIGVTIIAIGTSLPEVVTAVSSIRQDSTAIAIGNTVGANILSGTLLVGISAIIEPNKLIMHSNITYVALPLIILSSLVIFIPIMLNKRKYRLQGVLLLTIFVIYYATVIL